MYKIVPDKKISKEQQQELDLIANEVNKKIEQMWLNPNYRKEFINEIFKDIFKKD